MQQLSGTSSGKNKKSCRVFHHESKKNGFAFFLFFYYFLWILQDPAKALILFKTHFARRSLERMGILPKCPCFALRLSEIIGPLQLGPPGRAAAVRPKFRRARRCSRPGRGGATLEEYLGVVLHRIWGPGLRRRAGLTAVGSGRCCVAASGEAGARLRQSATGLAPAEARGALGGVARLRKRVPARLGSGAHGAAAAGLSRGSGALDDAKGNKATQGLNRRSACD
jgi:hypothetical protein